jgi:hypothetical protein
LRFALGALAQGLRPRVEFAEDKDLEFKALDIEKPGVGSPRFET